jgi:uncharacterized membrane protein YGL010W
MSLDLERHLVFYGAYHHNPKNQAIHMIGVPLILFSSFCLATNTGPLIWLPTYLTIPNLEPNLGTIAALVWGGLYVLLEPVAGTALAVLCLAGTAACSSIRDANPSLTNQWAIGINIGSWILQFIGHGVFEGRAPALLDNLFQAIFLAPLFVWLEILFKLGYRAELKARVDKATEAAIAKFQKSKAEKQT